MEIVWTYGAIDQHSTGFGPAWNWSGTAGTDADDSPVSVWTVKGRDRSNPTVAGTDRSRPSVKGRDRSQVTVAGTLEN